jgi:hypothetical protein
MSNQATTFEQRCDFLESIFEIEDYNQYVKFDDYCTANNLFTKEKMIEALPQSSIWMMDNF